MMPGARSPRGTSRQAMLAEVQALRQRVAALEQDKRDQESDMTRGTTASASKMVIFSRMTIMRQAMRWC
jgi:hypothetical protein